MTPVMLAPAPSMPSPATVHLADSPVITVPMPPSLCQLMQHRASLRPQGIGTRCFLSLECPMEACHFRSSSKVTSSKLSLAT